MTMFWTGFVKEGEDLYNYMINSYYDMFDGVSIKHFNIKYVSQDAMYYVDDIKTKYAKEIECSVIPWIHEEYKCGQLLLKNNWKIFRDRDLFDTMYLGYHKLFTYQHYYFQLALNSYCNCNDYPTCHGYDNSRHFELELYGWNDDKFNKIQPENKFIVLSDGLMPIDDWNDNN